LDYSKLLLTKLLEKYDDRGLYLNENGRRPVSITVQKAVPKYSDRYSSDVFHEINAAVDCLIRQGYINAEKDERGYYNRIVLQLDAVSRGNQECGRIPLGSLRQQQCHLIEQISDDYPLIAAFKQSQLSRFIEARPLDHGIGDDINKLKDVILALTALTSISQETYLRNFSEAIFRDSKRFHQIQGSIISILCTYGDPGLTKENALESFNLLANPAYVFLKGQISIKFQESSLSVFDIPGGISLPSAAISAIESVSIRGNGLMSVENLTTYHDEPEDSNAVLYLGGFHNSIRTQLLHLVYRDNQNKQYFHKGDLDVYGFLILENLKAKTGIPFTPTEMDLETLMEYESHGLVKPLSISDRRFLHIPRLASHSAVLSYMDRNNCKAEQEARSALRLLNRS